MIINSEEIMEEKIPRRLHYVWVGGKAKPEIIQRCIDSWKKFCPDYEIIEWNEHNFDISSNEVVSKAISQKNWALASDVIRLWAVYNYGGIYLDTDAEIIKSLDELLKHDAFIGYESRYWLNPATFGAAKGNELFKKCLERYDTGGEINFSTNALTVHTYGAMAKKLYGVKLKGKTEVLSNGLALYGEEYFCPKNYMSGKINITENSFVIHQYTSTWHSKAQKFWAGFAKRSRLILGKYIFRIFEKIVGRHYLNRINRDLKRAEKKDRKAGKSKDCKALEEIAAAKDKD